MPRSTLRNTPRDVPRKTRGQDGVAFSFSVGLLHPLQHAALSRRTTYNAQTTDVYRRLSASLVVGDLPLTIHRDSSPTDKSECIVRRSIAQVAPQRRELPRQSAHAVSKVRTLAAHSCCSRNRQPRASDERPCRALCARRRRQTVQFESQTSFTLPLVLHWPLHAVQQQPAREERQLATAVQTNAGGSEHNTPPLRSNGSRVHSLPNRTTSVRTTLSYRRTSLCSWRAHRFAQMPQHLTGTSLSACKRTAS